MIESILALPVQAHPWLVALGSFVVLWVLLRILVRLRWVSLNAAHVFQLAVLILICEGIRTRMPLPVFLAPWLKALELVLMALFTIQVVVKLYIGQYLEHRRRVFVARIIRDLTTVLIIALFALLFLRLVLNVNLAAILTPSAILTAIIGLSMQDTIGNFIAGLIIQTEKPFDLDDWIEVDGHRAQVREMNWRYTKIETTDKIYMIIPNNKISTDKVINYSKPTPVVKEFITIGVSYNVPPVKVKQAVLAILKANPHIVQKDDSAVLLHECGDSSIVYRIEYMIADPGSHRKIRDEVFSAIWYQFKKHAIEIPYPIRTVIMQQPQAQADLREPVRLLGSLPLFAGVSPEGLEHLVRFGLTHTIAPGHVVVRDQEPGDSMFFILHGDFNVMQDRRIAKVLHTGDFFGEMSLLTGDKRMAQVEAATRGSLLEIDRSAFKILIETEPAVLHQIETIFGDRCKANAEMARSKADVEALKVSLFQRFKKRFGLA
ncbi:MAG: mechanosensitive ion channel family protein [Kiritimatiellae bacterium]|nr:mechanosensitive ion channel family protein [Kiritimatiellia bacterium]